MRSGLRARSTANRSGARGKTTCQAANAKESDQLDPECVRLERRPAPIPRTAIVSGGRFLSRLPYGTPKTGMALTGTASPPKTLYWEGGMGALGMQCFRLQILPFLVARR